MGSKIKPCNPVLDVLASLKEKQKAISIKTAKTERAVEDKKTSANWANWRRITNRQKYYRPREKRRNLQIIAGCDYQLSV